MSRGRRSSVVSDRLQRANLERDGGRECGRRKRRAADWLRTEFRPGLAASIFTGGSIAPAPETGCLMIVSH